MAKRGRPPKDPSVVRSKQLSIYVSEALRERLERSRTSAVPKRSLNQEVELRLRAAFGEGEYSQLGGAANERIFKVIADYVHMAEQATGQRWWDDKYTFKLVLRGVVAAYSYFAPIGKGTAPPKLARMRPKPEHWLSHRALLPVQGEIAGAMMEAALEENPNTKFPLNSPGPAISSRTARTDFLRKLDAKGSGT